VAVLNDPIHKNKKKNKKKSRRLDFQRVGEKRNREGSGSENRELEAGSNQGSGNGGMG